MKNKFLLLAAALILSTATFAINQVSASNSCIVVSEDESKPELDVFEQIRIYMNNYDIAIVYVCPEQGTTNYFAKDTYGIWYRVYNVNGIWNGYEQVDY